jgi:hypothetical protein
MAGLAPVVALLGMKALGWRVRSMVTGGLVLVAVAVLALFPSQTALITGASNKSILSPSNLVYGCLAVAVWSALVGVCLRLARRKDPLSSDRIADWLLLAWLALELAGYFAMSPYPAARRVTGLVLVFTLLTGRVAHLAGLLPWTARWLSACGAALALLFFMADWFDASDARAAAREVGRKASLRAEGGTFWHLSWWGFSYYANREGMRPLQLNGELPRPGDLLAVHDIRELREALAIHQEIELELIDTVAVGDSFPLRALPGYYGGRTPLENQGEGRIRVLVYRVTGVTGPH